MNGTTSRYPDAAEIGFLTRFRGKGPVVFFSAVSALCGMFRPAEILPQDSGAARLSSPKIEIPFHLYGDTLIVVKATVVGRRHVNLILDTGANPSSITKTLADSLKLPRSPAAIKTLNGTIRTESVLLPAIDFGPIHRSALPVTVLDLGSLDRALGISLDGIIGLDILASGSFTIDYWKKSIAFGAIPPGLKTAPFAAREPLTIQASIDGREAHLMLDSGTGGVLLYRNRVTVDPTTSHFERRASISTISGSSRLTWLKTRVSIGKEDLGTREIAIADADSNFGDEFDGLIGFANMGFHRVAFDFQNGRFGWD